MAVIDKNKLLGKKEEKKGGALAVIPKSPLVVSSGGKLSKIPEKPQEDVVYTIRTRVIEIDKLLKGTLAEEKVQQKKERKQKEVEQRAQQETKLEKKDKDGEEEAPKSLIPKLSFLDGIKKFLGGVLMGWLTLRLIKFLPQIVSFLKPIASFVDFIINFGGKLLDGLVTFVDWGYKAVKGTEEWIGDVFGEDAAKKFNNFAETFTKFLNVALIAAMVGAKAGMFGMGGGGPRRGIINQGRRLARRVGRFFDPKRAEKLRRLKKLREIAKKRKAAEAALKRARMLRKLRPTNLRRVARVVTGKPIRAIRNVIQSGDDIVKNVIKSPAAQKVAQTTQNLIKNPVQTVQNIKQAGADKIDDIAKTGKNWFGRVKGAGKNLWGKLGQAKNFLGDLGKQFLNWADDFGKKFMANADEIIKGVSAKASNWAKSIGDIAEMARNPAKLVEKVKSVLGGQLDDVVKQNKTVAKLVNLAKNPKEITKGIKGLLNNAKKSKGLLQLRQGLKGAQKMKIGGIDKVIAAIMGLLDYTVFKESPINAILRAIGGLLGYTAGFAIGAPFGGAPGFITGMAGGFVGEKVAMLIAKGLAKTKLGEIQDPIMNDGRMLVRDPDNEKMNEELEGAQAEHGLGDDSKFVEIEKPKTQTLLQSGKKSNIEQALYDMRLSASKGSGEAFNDWVGNEKYAGDVDLIMKHGLQNVIIEGGRVTLKEAYKASLKGNAENILPLDVNSVAKKADDISTEASYEETGGETIIVKSGSEQDVDVETDSEEKGVPVVTGSSGGGGDSEVSDALYKSG